MKKYFLLVFALLINLLSPVFAQETGMLKGILKDSKGAAVGFANVALVQKEPGAVKSGTTADEAGNFRLKSPAPGTYFLRLSFVGFQATETESFQVNNENFSKDFGALVLKEDITALKEVSIQTMRPTITNHPDKMVMSVEGTAMAAGSSALEILTKAPGVWLDQDGNIQLNGKSGVRVMIDGKLTYLSGKELQTFLSGMSADNIKDLEIITNPSAKYDAEGAAGIININLKKNSLSGFNGSVYGGYQDKEMHGFTTGGKPNYKKSKRSTTTILQISRRGRLRTNTMDRAFKETESITTLTQKGRDKYTGFVPNFRLSTDYEISPKHSIGVMASLTYQDNETNFDTDSYLRTDINPAEDLYIEARNYTQKKFGNATFNLHYGGKLDTLGSTLSADVDFADLLFEGQGDFLNYYQPADFSAPAYLDRLGSDNPSGYRIWSAKTDYARPVLKTGKLELGAKASHVVSDNDLQFYFVRDNIKVADPDRSSHFIYTENIYAGYANFSTAISESIQVQAGLRAEQTVAEGHSITLDSINGRDYFGLFPSIFVQQKVSSKYQVNYNFSRRIDRPSYNNLNPFIFYLDPYSWAKGNPDLKPQYTNSFQVTQTYKDAYTLILGYANTAGFMAEIPLQNVETKTTEFQTRNVDNFENINANLILPVKISPKWEVNNNLSLEYQNYTIYLAEKNRRNEQLFFFAQSSHNIQLPKKIRMELTAGYQGPSAYGLYKIEQNWWMDAGFKRSFLKDQLDLSLNVTDIFRTRRVVGAANFDGNVNAFDQYFGMQSFRINLRYRFSRGEKFELKRRNTNLEELRRTGN